MKRPVPVAKIYEILKQRYGRQHWWPADTPFEVMVGAVLTQNTAWTNVERALDNLRSEGFLDPERIADASQEQLARLIKPSGFFNVKAERLQNFCRWYLKHGGLASLRRRHTKQLRSMLLEIPGIGPETADDVLLYALGRGVFVIDAYTRRIMGRLGYAEAVADYETLRALFESSLPARAPLYNEYHALLVHHGKSVCRKRPACGDCCLTRDCPRLGVMSAT